ncbi:MAG: hypothetical protein LUG52_06070 [Clostridia bacterium]|nr:hypothetical protein [Clostridia bacterium]
MKRLTAAFLAAVMMFAFCVSAGAEGLDFLDKDYTNYSMTATMKVTLNEPLELLNAVSEADMVDAYSGYDLQRIVESLLGSTITMKADCDASADYLSGKMYAEYAVNVPIEFSDDLTIAADAAFKCWIEYDFSDAENPKYVGIFTNPLKDGQYFTMDLSDAGELQSEVTQMSAQMTALMGDTMVLREAMLEAMQNNATVTTDGNKTTLAMTGENVIDMIFDALKIISDTYGENAQYLTGASMPSKLELEAARAFAKTLKIFGEDAMTQVYTTDEDGYVTKTEQKMHIDLNLYDLLTAFDIDGADIYYLTAENSNVDLTIEVVTEYDKIGVAEVTMPTLTEENSIDLANQPTYDYNLVNQPTYDYWSQWEYFYDSADAELVDFNDPYSGMLINAGQFFQSASHDGDNFVCTASYDAESKALTIVYSSDYIDETTLVMTAGSNVYYVNGEERTTVLAAKEAASYDGQPTLLIDMGIVGSLLGCSLDDISIYYNFVDGSAVCEVNASFTRKNFGYTEE